MFLSGSFVYDYQYCFIWSQGHLIMLIDQHLFSVWFLGRLSTFSLRYTKKYSEYSGYEQYRTMTYCTVLSAFAMHNHKMLRTEAVSQYRTPKHLNYTRYAVAQYRTPTYCECSQCEPWNTVRTCSTSSISGRKNSTLLAILLEESVWQCALTHRKKSTSWSQERLP